MNRRARLRRIIGVLLSAVLFCAAFSIASPQSKKGAKLKAVATLFHTSDRCIACHNQLTTAAGEDVSIGLDWRPTMMANSGRDPYWQAGVRRETIDHPESRAAIEDECSICHMPMARTHARANGHEGQIFSHLPFDPGKEQDRLAADGVSCSLCHQITKETLGTRASFVGGYVIDTRQSMGERPEYGPFSVDPGHARIMRSSTGGFQPTESAHIRESELCATCHTLYTQALGPEGKVMGELPEQVPYQEWLHSDYRQSRSCQSCHMPEVAELAPATPVFGEPRTGFSRHVFVGGNFFMQRLLNRYRRELQIEALPQELDLAASRTKDHLAREAATISISAEGLAADRLSLRISVRNLGGHKLPTAFPSRRTWLHLVVRDLSGRVLFESGALQPNGMISGNDNDVDAARFEPHYREITDQDQVQIFEAIMADSSGRPTTGLLQAVRYIKDNRLLPAGFDKQTAAQDVAVSGNASSDPDFAEGGDTVRYSVKLNGAQGELQVVAELWYQPIGFRWAENLRRYDAFEPRRFVGYYESMGTESATVLARATAVVKNPL